MSNNQVREGATRRVVRTGAVLAAASIVGIGAASAASAATAHTAEHTSAAHVVAAASNFSVLANISLPK